MYIEYTFDRIYNGRYSRWGEDRASAKYPGVIQAPAGRSPYAYAIFMHEASHALQEAHGLMPTLGWTGCEAHAWALVLAFITPKWYKRIRAYALLCLTTYYDDKDTADMALIDAEDTINAMWHRS